MAGNSARGLKYSGEVIFFGGGAEEAGVFGKWEPGDLGKG